jgi:maltooligosyltrehalose synthase
VFSRGGYKAVPIAGRHAGHVFAFERRLGARAVFVFVARRLAPFANAGRSWPDFNALDANATVNVRELRDSISRRSIIGLQDGEQSTFDLGALFDRIPVVVCEADTPTKP